MSPKDLRLIAETAVTNAAYSIASSSTELLRADNDGANVSTDADKRAHESLFKTLGMCTPGVRIISEETFEAPLPREGSYWLLDPLDGSKNWSLGVLYWACAAGFIEDGQVKACAVASPGITTFNIHSAAVGQGATKNAKRLTIPPALGVTNPFVEFDSSYEPQVRKQQLNILHKVFPEASVSCRGSQILTMARVAEGIAGGIDLYSTLALKPWDLAPGVLMITEALGRVIDLDTGEAPTLDTVAVLAGAQNLVSDTCKAVMAAKK